MVEVTPGVDFINVLRAALARADPKSTKNTVKSSGFFALLGSSCVKAAHRTLLKFTPGANTTKKFTPSLGIPYSIQLNSIYLGV